jgi:hypothetical protein
MIDWFDHYVSFMDKPTAPHFNLAFIFAERCVTRYEKKFSY